VLLQTTGLLQREPTVADQLLIEDMPEETKRIINAVVGSDIIDLEQGYAANLHDIEEENDTLTEKVKTLEAEVDELKATLRAMVRLADKHDLLVY
jgi:phage host-nuclease inhibitor protein Gam